MLLWNTPRALFCESQGSPCCWEPQSELHYFLFGTVTYFYWRCSRNGAESCRGCVLQRAIKPWGMEGRQALFFSLYGCCSKGKGFCYLLAFDILLRKEEDIFFSPPQYFEEKLWWVLCCVGAALSLSTGRSSTKRLWKPRSTCGTSSEVAAATRAWLIFVCIHWTVCANSFMPALPSRYGSQWKLGIKKSPWFKLGAVCWIW